MLPLPHTHRHAARKLVQVKKICAIAHIDLDPDGEGSFDAASATRDVGAILRVMQSVRTGQGHGRDGAAAAESKEEGEEEMGVDREEEGPWGGAAAWAAPLQKVWLDYNYYMCVSPFASPLHLTDGDTSIGILPAGAFECFRSLSVYVHRSLSVYTLNLNATRGF